MVEEDDGLLSEDGDSEGRDKTMCSWENLDVFVLVDLEKWEDEEL
jgi:hypothetical protein